MKASMSNATPGFKPVTFSFTCESEEEVRMLYTILNVSSDVQNGSTGDHGAPVSTAFGYRLWRCVANYFNI